MENIEAHIEKDKKILEDPTTSPQQRRHVEGELHEIEAGDHHDPTALELYCEVEPGAPECKTHDN